MEKEKMRRKPASKIEVRVGFIQKKDLIVEFSKWIMVMPKHKRNHQRIITLYLTAFWVLSYPVQ